MGYTPKLNDKNSPYYYGVDSTYTPPSRKQKPAQRKAVPSPLLLDDPELQGYTNIGATVTPGKQQPRANTDGMTNNTSVTPVNGSFRTAVLQGKDGKRTPSSGNAGSGIGGRSETRTNPLNV